LQKATSAITVQIFIAPAIAIIFILKKEGKKKKTSLLYAIVA